MRLFLFGDTPKTVYSYVAYAGQNGQSALGFAKFKVAPFQGKSLPS